MVEIRPEKPADIEGIRHINTVAFGAPTEALLVDALRVHASPFVSLVAELEGVLVGHVAVSPVTLEKDGTVTNWVGLAPLAVLPDHQKQGVGAALMQAAIAACRDIGAGAIVLLGSPAYYPRFGFEPAANYGLTCVYDPQPGAFMVQELFSDALAGKSGTVQYHSAFAEM